MSKARVISCLYNGIGGKEWKQDARHRLSERDLVLSVELVPAGRVPRQRVFGCSGRKEEFGCEVDLVVDVCETSDNLVVIDLVLRRLGAHVSRCLQS